MFFNGYRKIDQREISLHSLTFKCILAIIFLNYFSFCMKNNNSSDSLKFVAIIFRHGDRSPSDLYPNDPHKDYKWPGGREALSPNGTFQLYNLGKILRNKYIKLLPNDGIYHKDNMIVTSSYAERCLMSAQAFLAGFMPSNESFNTLPIPWQPVAVNSIPRDRDNTIAQKMTCKKFDQMLTKMVINPHKKLRDFLNEHSETISYISRHAGKDFSVIAPGESLYSILSIQKKAGLLLPEWTDNVFPDKLLPIAKYNLALLTEFSYMKKIKGGPFITEIVDLMHKKITGNLSPNRNVFIYSGHDTSLVNIMRALEIIDQTSELPDFGSTLAFELHQRHDFDNYEIKIWYYFNGLDESPIKIEIPNCDEPCFVHKFNVSVENVLVRNFTDACKLDK